MSASKSSRGLIILLGVVVVAAAAWFGWQQFGGDTMPAPNPTTIVKPKKPAAPPSAPAPAVQEASKNSVAGPNKAAHEATATATAANAEAPVANRKPTDASAAATSTAAAGPSDSTPKTAMAAPANARAYALPRGDIRYCLDLKDDRAIAHCAVQPKK